MTLYINFPCLDFRLPLIEYSGMAHEFQNLHRIEHGLSFFPTASLVEEKFRNIQLKQ